MHVDHEKILNEAKAELKKLETNKKLQYLYQTDERYKTYKQWQEMVELGQLLENKLINSITRDNAALTRLKLLRSHSPPVDTMLKEIEQQIPESKRRNDQQLLEAHYKKENISNFEDEETEQEYKEGEFTQQEQKSPPQRKIVKKMQQHERPQVSPEREEDLNKKINNTNGENILNNVINEMDLDMDDLPNNENESDED
jgi:hypothetical protein